MHPGSIPGEASKPLLPSAFQTGALRGMSDLSAMRRTMVDTQLRTYDVTSKRVLDAFETVAREHFVPTVLTQLAYTDQPVTVRALTGQSRALVPPMVLARMIQSLELEPGSQVLAVAGGTGYGAAVLAQMGCQVTLMEADDGLADLARAALAKAGAASIVVTSGAFEQGAAAGASFDSILVEGAIETEPKALLAHLQDGGRLVAVMGRGRAGRVVVIQRNGETFGHRSIFDASVPVLEAFLSKPGFQF